MLKAKNEEHLAKLEEKDAAIEEKDAKLHEKDALIELLQTQLKNQQGRT